MALATLSFLAFAYAIQASAAGILAGVPGAARRWEPAERTAHPADQRRALGSQPTNAPEIPTPKALAKRRTNICGYVSGMASMPFDCLQDECLYDSSASILGCALTVSGRSNAPTVCYDSTQMRSFSLDNGLTTFCGNSKRPYCYTYTYVGSLFSGYSIFDCDIARGVRPIYFYATDTTMSSASSAAKITTTLSGSVTTSASTSSSSTTSGLGGTVPPTSNVESGSGTPVGAIIGGVLGGIAVLALIGFGVWFFVRQSKKTRPRGPLDANPSADAYQNFAGGSGQGNSSAPISTPQTAAGWGSPQHQQQGFAGAHDPRMSMVKGLDGSYHPTMAPVSSIGTPPPPLSPYSALGQDTVGTPPPHDSFQHQSGSISQYSGMVSASELPTQRSDGALRELPG